MVVTMVEPQENIFASLRAWAEIDENALLHNFDLIRKILPESVKIAAVIKADAYGHGARAVAEALRGRADYFAVAMTDEAVELRKSGVEEPILVLSHALETDYEALARYDIETTVSSYEEAQSVCAWSAARGKRIGFHIALDTGMTRIGFLKNAESIKEIKKISTLDGSDIRGVFSHYASADEADKTYANTQTQVFGDFIEELEKEGVRFPIKHICNSASIIEMKDKFDMARAGIILYGLKPSDEVDLSILGDIKPVMSLKTRVSHVKTVPADVPVSYGCTYVTNKETVIATLSAGYADGVPRLLSNKGNVIIHGKKAPIIGRVCMDQMMADVTEIEGVKTGDEVVIFGKVILKENGEVEITADEVAEIASTIGYEIVCAVNRRVPRVYIKDSKAYKIVNSLVN